MANESFELGRELTGASRRGTQVEAAKSDKSLPVQQICVRVHVSQGCASVYSYASVYACVCLLSLFSVCPVLAVVGAGFCTSSITAEQLLILQ